MTGQSPRSTYPAPLRPPAADAAEAYWDAIRRDDREMLWHPYTSMRDPLPTYAVKRAEGVYLELADGRKVVDGMSSWWAAIHGYNVPELNEAATRQLHDMAHVMFGGLTHAPAVELGRRLLALAPSAMRHVFLADSGSVSVEVAIKMALQYQMALGHTKRSKILGFLGGYHGDTAGAMAVCDPVGGMHHVFRGVLPTHIFADRPRIRFDQPWEESEGVALRALIDANADTLAAVFVEPVVQGAGGMWFYHPNYLKVVREACDAHGIVMVADEIATGFGRTGKMWGCDHAGVTPDVLCVGKALTGGYMTLAATLTTQHVADVMASGEAGVLMHGPTFMGNPLACAVACASLDLLVASSWEKNVALIESRLREGLTPLTGRRGVKDVRVLGAIGVVEVSEIIDVSKLQKVFLHHGAWLRPFRNLMYIMPPYRIGSDETQTLIRAIEAGVATL